ncbi:WD40-repeat-containing domain protein [Paraphysoderma sedebokerense]|nr:WD40-repeat-containing domain protein [Paraphysoderma sedebokerense]
MSGKVSKDLIYCTPIMNSEPVSSIEIESGRIAVGFPSGHIALVKDFKFNSIHRTFQLITLPLSFGTQAAIQSSSPHAQHQTAVKVLKWVGTTREQLLLSGSIDGQIRLWDLSKKVREDAGCCVAYLEGGKSSISHISVDQSNNFVVAAASKYIQIWSVDFSTISRTEANVGHLVAVIPPSRQITLDSSISHLHFNHQSFPYIIVSTQASQFLSIYNVITGDLIATCKNGHVESITAINVLIISPRSNTFTSQSSISSALSHSPSPSPSPSFSNSELGFRHLPHIMVLSGDQTGRIVLWNIPESSLRHISNSVSTFSSSSSFALSPSTSSFPSASVLLRGHEHDPVAFEPFKTLTGHADKITCIESDEVKIVSGSLDGWTKIWEPISGRCVQNFSSRLRNNARVAHPQHDPDNSRKAVKSIQMGIYQVVVGLVSGIVKTFDFEKNREPGSLIKKRPKKKRHSVSQRHKPFQGNPSTGTRNPYCIRSRNKAKRKME